ncbi:MAG: response regulator [Verrucomicrobiota bacterium]
MDRSVLILDEDQDYCNLLREVYSQADYSVTLGVVDQDLSEVLRELLPSIVVIDYKFGEHRGVDLVRLIHSISPESKVIVASAPLPEQTIRGMIMEEIDGLFTKPLKPISFLKRSSELLTEKKHPDQESDRADDSGSVKKQKFSSSAFPGRSLAAKRFIEKLMQVKEFKSRLLLVGAEGSPFRSVAQDLVDSLGRNTEALAFFAAFELNVDSLEAQVNQLKKEGFDSLTVSMLDGEKLTDEDVRTVREIQAADGFAERWKFPIRFIFCIRTELDVLYDRQEVSTSVYMTLGATELVIPSLSECLEDIPRIAQRMIRKIVATNNIGIVPTLDNSAKEYLRSQPWGNGFDELEVLLHGILIKGNLKRLSDKHFLEDSPVSQSDEEQTSPLRRHLVTQRDEYIQAVLKMSGGDISKASSSLGIDIEGIKRFLSQH